MRWKHEVKEKDRSPKYEGETRIVSKFLWFPKRLKNETRWLENTKIVEKGIVQSLSMSVQDKRGRAGGGYQPCPSFLGWEEDCFYNDDDHQETEFPEDNS